jgi:DNA polymerase-3 subunit alpha
MAVTEHAHTGSWYAFEKAAKEVGIKPIFGVETYWVPQRKVKGPTLNVENFGMQPAHLLLLAKNQKGISSLNRLVSASYEPEAYYRKPRTDWELLERYNEGVIATSACLSGPPAKYILEQSYAAGGNKKPVKTTPSEKDAANWIYRMKDIFGEDFYLELQPHDIKDQIILNEYLASYRSAGFEFIVTNDSHYPTAPEWYSRLIRLAISRGSTVKREMKTYPYDNEFHIKSLNELYREMKKNHHGLGKDVVIEALEKTRELTQTIDVSLAHGLSLMPDYDGEGDAPTEFKRRLRLGYEKKIINVPRHHADPETYKERMRSEWRMMTSKGFSEYFLSVADAVDAAKNIGLMVGVGRGSAGGSLACYLLDITEVDPIRWDLPLERFLSPHRGGINLSFHTPSIITRAANNFVRHGKLIDDPGVHPDEINRICLDQVRLKCYRSERYEDEYDKRIELELREISAKELSPYYLEMVRKEKKVQGDCYCVAYLLGITDTFSPIKPLPIDKDWPDIDTDFSDRGPVIEWLKRRYGPEKVAYINNFNEFKGKTALRDVAKVLGEGVPSDIQNRVEELESVKSFLKEVKEKKYTKIIAPKTMEIIEEAAHIEGNLRQMGKTAAGVIVSSREVRDFSAIWRPAPSSSNSGDEISVYDKEVAEDIGFAKIDFLGLANIEIIRRALELIPEGDRPDDIWDLPQDDPQMLKEFSEAHTSLIFQYGGRALKELLSRLEPEGSADVIAANSLVRPGADDESYIRRKRGIEPVSYPHSLTEPILEDTYGIIVYQEQVMTLCRDVAGMYWRDVNRVRKMVGRKDTSEAGELSVLFVRGCVTRGVDQDAAERLWEEILTHGSYSFNRAHAVAYYITAWANMYFQVYHRTEWILANLQVHDDDNDTYKTIYEGHRLGVGFRPVSVNTSDVDWTEKDGHLVPGLRVIPGIGKSIATRIVDEREKNGPFESLEDMKERIPSRFFNVGAQRALAKVGAYPSLEADDLELYDPELTRVINGERFDLSETYDIHPFYNAENVSGLHRGTRGAQVIYGYVRSCRKSQSGAYYILSVQGDSYAEIFSTKKVEPGPYILLIDSWRFQNLFTIFPIKEAAEHPLDSPAVREYLEEQRIKLLTNEGGYPAKEGLAWVIHRKHRPGFPPKAFVVGPNPMVINLRNSNAHGGFHYFEKHPFQKGQIPAYGSIEMRDLNDIKAREMTRNIEEEEIVA